MNRSPFFVKGQWTQTLGDGREVTFTYGRMLCGLASARAWVEGSRILHVRNNLRESLRRHQVEALFRSELTEVAA